MLNNSQQFIEKAKTIHGDKYDYSLVHYINNKTKINILCPVHGIFEQEPRTHLSRSGCPKCGDIKTQSSTRYNTEKFIKIASSKYKNFYDYSLVDYKNTSKKVKIICPIHGVFEQSPNSHLSGHGCPKCAINSRGQQLTKEQTFFINQANHLHKNKYDYSKVVYESNGEAIIIICPIHGEYKQTPSKHLSGQACPICKESKGEREIRNYLIENKISFIRQYKFNDCRNIKPLPFDFYLPDFNTCIEFNGGQHYNSVEYWGGEETLKNVQYRDNIKMEYCKNNNIPLIILKNIKNINSCLNKQL